MKRANLFSGIGVVIDDEIDQRQANISKILRQIERRKVPCLRYKEIPENAIYANWEGVSFILLDWKLPPAAVSSFVSQGVRLPATADQASVNDNISFLKELRKVCFAPVFIFTNENLQDVMNELQSNDLYKANEPNYIFLRSKSSLEGRNMLFREIRAWIKKTPSVYVLKAWESEYRKSKTKLFHDFYKISPVWPKVLWQTFSKDGVNASFELGETITRNLYSRMAPFSFDKEILSKRGKAMNPQEMRDVIGGERFISNDGLHPEAITTGDIFKISGDIYINIRPECDCVPDRNSGNPSKDVELYLLKGTKLSDDKEKEALNRVYGHFDELDCQAVVFSMIAQKSYDFRFKQLKIEEWSKIKSKRIGRLLPPYITRIQQRFSAYIQRQGMPRIPDSVIGRKTRKKKAST